MKQRWIKTWCLWNAPKTFFIHQYPAFSAVGSILKFNYFAYLKFKNSFVKRLCQICFFQLSYYHETIEKKWGKPMLSWLFGTIKLQIHLRAPNSASFRPSDCGSYKAAPKGTNKPSHCMSMLMAQEKGYEVLVLNELYILNIVRCNIFIFKRAHAVLKDRVAPLALRIPREGETEVKAVEHPAQGTVRHCHGCWTATAAWAETPDTLSLPHSKKTKPINTTWPSHKAGLRELLQISSSNSWVPRKSHAYKAWDHTKALHIGLFPKSRKTDFP